MANSDKEKITNTESIDTEQKDISTVLENIIKHVGELGLYQRLLFLCMLPFGMVWSFVYFGQMFITATPQKHWCRVPELEGLSVDLRRSLSIPKVSDDEYDQCNMFVANYTFILETLLPPEAGTPTMPCGNGWEFLFEDIPYSTVVNEREWVCDRSYLVPWTQTIGFFGSMAGGILCGTLADRYGRLPVLILANLVGCIGSVGTIFTTDFWDFSICRFLVGMSCDSCFLMIYILVLEYIGTKYRSLVANMSIALYFGGGCLMMPWLALWVGNWRHYVLVISAPMLLALATPFVVPESARWLVSKGRVDKAVQILKKFEKINKSKIPDDVLEEFISIAGKTKEKEEGLMTIFKSSSLRLTLIFLIITFMGVAIVFDGIIRLSENLGLDFFLTFTVTSLTEIPSILILVLLLDRLGRRYMVMGPMLIAGILSLIAAFVPRELMLSDPVVSEYVLSMGDLGLASVSLAVLARFFNNMSYGAVIQWTPELLPTSVRAAGASLVHVSSFAAVTLSPFIIYSDRLWEGLSLVLMGMLGVLASGLALLVPETAGRRMPQTMDNWEELAQTTRFGRKKTDGGTPKAT